RAVRAALAIQRALAELNARNAATGVPDLAARIGLDSGSVVVDATGEVFGEAPNVAARVQSAAEPGSILITAAVQRQVAGLFVAEDRGAHELKGVSEPATLYRIVRASGGGRRGGARTLTPLVGREEELDLLSRRWERARSGEGQLVSDAVRQTRSATPELPFHLPDLGDDFGIGQRRDIAGVFVVRDGREDTAHDLAGTRLRHVRH